MSVDMRTRFHPSASINLFVFCFTNAPMQGGSINKDSGLDYPSDPIWLVARTGELNSMDYLFGCTRWGLVKPLFEGVLHENADPNKKELFIELVKNLPGPALKSIAEELLSDRLITEVIPAKKGYRETPTLNGAVLIPGVAARSLPFTPQSGFPLFLRDYHLQGFVKENQARQRLDISESLTRSLKPHEVIENGTYRLNLSFPDSDLKFARHALNTFEERSRAVREASWRRSMSIRLG